MPALQVNRRQYLWGTILFTLLFCLTGVLVASRQHDRDRADLENHARIITDDIWAINPAGVEKYLHLAMEAQHYQYLQVTSPGGDVFVTVVQEQPDRMLEILHSIGLVPTRKMQVPISYGDLPIGTLEGAQYVLLILSLAELFPIFFGVFLIYVFILFLMDRRRVLERLVRERTVSLEESQRRFHDLVNLLPEMVLETDLDGKVLYANNEARSRLGLGRVVMPGGSFFTYFPDDEQWAVRKHFQGLPHETPLYEGRLLDHWQQPFPVLMRSGPIMRDNRCVGARLLLIDITERQRLEQQLNHDRKMKAIGLMAGGVAHDLNNILSGVVGYPELLLLDMDRDNPLYRTLSLIHKAGVQASQVVEDLLTVARGSRGRKQAVDPNELIREYLDSPDFDQLRNRHPQVIHEFMPEEEVSHLLGSAIHLRKCLMNLVINGTEAIAGTGKVRIATDNVAAGEEVLAHLGLVDNIPYVKISVSDTGQGIEQTELQKIFEPFYSKKVMGRSGTGLGLTVVWNTVRDHGGSIKVRSSAAGTTFDLFFPATGAKPEQEDARELVRGNSETILVIDDEAPQREVAVKMLSALGYRVLAAASGEEAMKKLADEPVDLLVLDMVMGPGQPGGREIYRRILARYPQQKAIIASGFAEDDEVRLTMAMGARVYVAKPYTLAVMSRSIQRALRQEEMAEATMAE